MRCLGVLLLAALTASAQDPLPIKSAKLSGETYTLSGRHKLETGMRLTLGPGVKVVGQGDSAVLALEGGALEVAGEPGAEVVLENVWVILGWKFRPLKIVHAKFSGKGGVCVPHESETRGKVFLDHVAFADDASIWATFHEGGAELRNVTAQSTCMIAATAPDRNVKLEIEHCRFVMQGDPNVIQGGLRVFRVKEVQVVNTQVDGMEASFTDAAKLTLEGCRFDTRAFWVMQEHKDRMGKTQIAHCDFGCKRIEFKTPDAGGRDRVILKECHFRGDADTEPDEIVRKRIEATGVQVVVKSPSPTPNGLADPDKGE